MARPAVITIDGPVAAGKTVVGRLLSQKLDYRFLDTGVMYRAITWLALVRGTSLDDEQALGRLAQETTISLQGRDSRVVLVDGRQLSPELREPQVDRAVSLVSRVPEVRVAMVRQQREIAKDGAIVVVGRDVGTVVLPGADLKLFFVASVSERARRRHAEVAHQGGDAGYDQVLQDLEARDNLDTNRSDSPLRPAPDAQLMDTDGMSAEQVARKVLDILGENRWL